MAAAVSGQSELTEDDESIAGDAEISSVGSSNRQLSISDTMASAASAGSYTYTDGGDPYLKQIHGELKDLLAEVMENSEPSAYHSPSHGVFDYQGLDFETIYEFYSESRDKLDRKMFTRFPKVGDGGKRVKFNPNDSYLTPADAETVGFEN